MICFLSYTRRDKAIEGDKGRDPYFDKFVSDLNDRLIKLTGVEDPLFVDTNMEPGADWPETLANALATCRVFAYLHSATYFSRPDCGREWRVFRDRMKSVNAVINQPNQLSPMIPILWMPTTYAQTIPEEIARIQYTIPGVDPRYETSGLQRLAKTSGDAAYIDTVDAIAEHILKCSGEVGLRPAEAVEDFSKIAPAFPVNPVPLKQGERRTQAGISNVSRMTGIRYAQFIFVAAPPSELKQSRTNLSPYEPEGGDMWKPYFAEAPELNAALIAQKAAYEVKLVFEKATIVKEPGAFRKQLDQAMEDNKPVVILIDVWTLQLPAYNDVLKEMDRVQYYNCVPIMPWNLKDQETAVAQSSLRKVVDDTFMALLGNGKIKPNFENVTTVEQLQSRIETALAEIKNTMIRKLGRTSEIGAPPVPLPILPAPAVTP